MPYGTLNVDKIVNDNGVTFAGLYGFKNRIINGAMMIDQRNAGAVYTPTGGAITYGSVDRWQFAASAASKYTVQRNAGSVTPPAGFTNYLGAVSSSAYSVGSTEQFNILQAIEGFNTADLGWGAAGAQTVTLSFWVRSSLTGTFGGVLSNDGKSRAYPFTYTISAANTWEYKTLTIAGDTSGTWNTTTGVGIYVTFGLGVGSSASAAAGSWTGAGSIFGATGAVSVVGTNGATFYITGVQLEKGSTATSFDFRPYGTELMLCQRYYETSFPAGTAPANGGSATTFPSGVVGITPIAPWSNTAHQSANIRFLVPKRATPNMTTYGNSSGHLGYISNGSLPTSGTTFTFSSLLTVSAVDSNSFYANNQVVQACLFNVAGGWAASSEL